MMKITMMASYESYWASITADIEAHLKQSIPIRPPLVVFEPMHHLAFPAAAAAKNTAPALCLAACELVGGDRVQAISAASAIHLMHAAAFTHQHLQTEKPNSKPMTHHLFGPNIKLLTGDGLIPFGYELLARSDKPGEDNSGQILRVIIEIARATGSQGTIDGQYRENQLTRSNSDESCQADRIDHVLKKKEGELHACGAACGAILGGGSEDEIEKLRRFGLYVGMIKGVGGEEKNWVQRVEELRELALKELKDFDEVKVRVISSIVEGNFVHS